MARPRLTHVELQDQATSLLRMMGWRWLHVRKSVGRGKKWTTTTNIVGWPDLAPCWNPRQPGRLVAIEIKVSTKLTADQEACLADLASSGWETYVITDDNFDDLKDILRRGGSTPTRR